jgi:hypothetical protein
MVKPERQKFQGGMVVLLYNSCAGTSCRPSSLAVSQAQVYGGTILCTWYLQGPGRAPPPPWSSGSSLGPSGGRA